MPVINGQKFKLTHEPLGDQFASFAHIKTKHWFVWKQLDSGTFEFRGHTRTKREAETWMQEMATVKEVEQ